MKFRGFLTNLALGVGFQVAQAIDELRSGARRPPPSAPAVVVAVEVEGLEELEELEAMLHRVKDAYAGAADVAERFAETAGLREPAEPPAELFDPGPAIEEALRRERKRCAGILRRNIDGGADAFLARVLTELEYKILSGTELDELAALEQLRPVRA